MRCRAVPRIKYAGNRNGLLGAESAKKLSTTQLNLLKNQRFSVYDFSPSPDDTINFWSISSLWGGVVPSLSDFERPLMSLDNPSIPPTQAELEAMIAANRKYDEEHPAPDPMKARHTLSWSAIRLMASCFTGHLRNTNRRSYGRMIW